ncbi:MAG: hypothetical protein NT015_03610 [Alphaproteobacteria bacterium]|nr:hypothetical protein [Alphaproteobacteria bacterium]
MQRRPNIGSAGSDLAFALLALIAGWTGLALLFPILVFACAVTSWGWTRRRPLMQLSPKSRLTQGAISVAMIAVVTGVAYWIGLALGGHT